MKPFLSLILLLSLVLISCGKRSKNKKGDVLFVDSTDISKLEHKPQASSSSKNIAKAFAEVLGNALGTATSCVLNGITNVLVAKQSIEFSLHLVEQVHSELSQQTRFGYLRFWRYLSATTRKKIQLEILSQITQTNRSNILLTESDIRLLEKASALFFIQTFLDRYALGTASTSTGDKFFQTQYGFLINNTDSLTRIQFSVRGLKVDYKIKYEPCFGLSLETLEHLVSLDTEAQIFECLNDEASSPPFNSVFTGPLFYSYLILGQKNSQLISAQTHRHLQGEAIFEDTLVAFNDQENETVFEIHLPETWRERQALQSIPALYMGTVREFNFSNKAKCRKLQ
jgi:hypothetical protein